MIRQRHVTPAVARRGAFLAAVMLVAANVVLLQPPAFHIEHMGQPYLNRTVTPRGANQRKRRKRRRQRASH